MCMYSTRQHPLIAKKDIVCVKYLKQRSSDVLITPCQETPVVLNKPFIPNSCEADIRPYNSMVYSLNGGVIHAKTINKDSDWSGCNAYKAIIPAGTEYYVDVRGHCIAARQMIITKEKINISVPDKSLIVDILEQVPTIDGISVGDYYIKDKGFISPFNVTKETTTDGIVVGFKEDNSPLICSKEICTGIMDRDCNSKFDEFVSDPDNDADGEKHLKAFLKKYKDFDKNRFEAYGKCVSYKPEIGEWYIPACKEQEIMVQNLMFIYASAWLTGSDAFITPGWYWTSSECVSGDCWGVLLYGSYACRGWDGRCYCGRVCFFLANTNKIPKIKINNCLTTEQEESTSVKKNVRKRKA